MVNPFSHKSLNTSTRFSCSRVMTSSLSGLSHFKSSTPGMECGHLLWNRDRPFSSRRESSSGARCSGSPSCALCLGCSGRAPTSSPTTRHSTRNLYTSAKTTFSPYSAAITYLLPSTRELRERLAEQQLLSSSPFSATHAHNAKTGGGNLARKGQLVAEERIARNWIVEQIIASNGCRTRLARASATVPGLP